MPLSPSLTAALAEAFDREARAARLFHEAALRADIEGRPVIAAMLRSVADCDAGHAGGHRRLAEGEVTLAAILRGAIAEPPGIAAERYEALAKEAASADEHELAAWLDACARMEHRNLARLRGALNEIEAAP